MSKKINLVTPGISRSKLWSLFKEYASRKVKEEEEYWRNYAKRMRHGGYPYYLVDDYDDDYYEGMEELREYYSNQEHPSDEDDYYVDDDGCIIFPNLNNRGKSKADDFITYLECSDDEEEYFNKLNKLNSKGKHKHKKHRSRFRSKKRYAQVVDINTPYSGFEEDPDEVGVGTGKIYYYPNYNDKYDRLEFDSLVEFDKYCQEEGFLVPPYVGEKLAYHSISHCCLNPIAKERGVLEIMAEDSYGDMHYEACDESELGI